VHQHRGTEKKKKKQKKTGPQNGRGGGGGGDKGKMGGGVLTEWAHPPHTPRGPKKVGDHFKHPPAKKCQNGGTGGGGTNKFVCVGGCGPKKKKEIKGETQRKKNRQ